MRWLTHGLIAAALLTGCAAVNSDPICGTLFDYAPEFQKQAAQELSTLPPGSAVGELVADYGVVRQEIRACRG